VRVINVKQKSHPTTPWPQPHSQFGGFHLWDLEEGRTGKRRRDGEIMVGESPPLGSSCNMVHFVSYAWWWNNTFMSIAECKHPGR
jgi:hypothetical protein